MKISDILKNAGNLADISKEDQKSIITNIERMLDFADNSKNLATEIVLGYASNGTDTANDILDFCPSMGRKVSIEIFNYLIGLKAMNKAANISDIIENINQKNWDNVIKEAQNFIDSCEGNHRLENAVEIADHIITEAKKAKESNSDNKGANIYSIHNYARKLQDVFEKEKIASAPLKALIIKELEKSKILEIIANTIMKEFSLSLLQDPYILQHRYPGIGSNVSENIWNLMMEQGRRDFEEAKF